MAGGLVALFDDIAALAKLAAASVDDVGAAAGRASVKAAGVVIDDTAVTPTYVQGLAAEREVPIIRRIALGSLRNKLVFILPVAIVLSSVAPALVEIILMFGGAYLAYEGAHKIVHGIRGDHGQKGPAVLDGTDAEEATVRGAIRTDFILSTEIMVIALKDVLHEPVVSRAVILGVVAVLITVAVYGLVAVIVKMDDVGLSMTKRDSESARRFGRSLVLAMPRVLAGLTVVGIAAMTWVGGHILVAGANELGWHAPYDLVHDLAHAVPFDGVVGGVLSWLVNTMASAFVGLVVGVTVLFASERVRALRGGSAL